MASEGGRVRALRGSRAVVPFGRRDRAAELVGEIEQRRWAIGAEVSTLAFADALESSEELPTLSETCSGSGSSCRSTTVVSAPPESVTVDQEPLKVPQVPFERVAESRSTTPVEASRPEPASRAVAERERDGRRSCTRGRPRGDRLAGRRGRVLGDGEGRGRGAAGAVVDGDRLRAGGRGRVRPGVGRRVRARACRRRRRSCRRRREVQLR